MIKTNNKNQKNISGVLSENIKSIELKKCYHCSQNIIYLFYIINGKNYCEECLINISEKYMTNKEAKSFFGKKLWDEMVNDMKGINISYGKNGIIIPAKAIWRSYWRLTQKK